MGGLWWVFFRLRELAFFFFHIIMLLTETSISGNCACFLYGIQKLIGIFFLYIFMLLY